MLLRCVSKVETGVTRGHLSDASQNAVLEASAKLAAPRVAGDMFTGAVLGRRPVSEWRKSGPTHFLKQSWCRADDLVRD